MQPGQPEVSAPWAAERLGLADLHALSRGDGVTVAVIDSGLNADGHPQLAGVRVAPGANVIDGADPADTRDCSGHGTAVAGIIAAQPIAGSGFVGVAPGATVLPIKQSATDADGTAAGLARGIRAALARGATVINVSVTVAVDDPDLRAATDEAEAAGAVVVAAAGNSAQQGNPPAYPAAYPTVIAVAASAADDSIANYSNVGGYVDLAAPGDAVETPATFGGFITRSGTSFAAPVVAGVAALIRSAYPQLSAAQVRHRLLSTADSPGLDVPEPHYGYGIVNPRLALTAIGAEAPSPIADPPRPAAADRSAQNRSLAVGAGLLLPGGALALVVLARRTRSGRGRQPL